MLMSAGVGTGAGTARNESVDLEKSFAGCAWVVGSMLGVKYDVVGELLRERKSWHGARIK